VTDWGRVLRQAVRIGRDLLSARSAAPSEAQPQGSGARSARTSDGARTVRYAPDLDGAADPGEIVWAWVPFEEGDGRGKDRPVLVVGREGGGLLGLMLSSRDDRAGEQDWVGIGSGAWDAQGRESYARLDRVLELDEGGIRREGAVLDRDRFDRVAQRLRGQYGWR
jgi:hypothetical protein